MTSNVVTYYRVVVCSSRIFLYIMRRCLNAVRDYNAMNLTTKKDRTLILINTRISIYSIRIPSVLVQIRALPTTTRFVLSPLLTSCKCHQV